MPVDLSHPIELSGSYRSKNDHSELLSFNLVTKEGAAQYFISSDAILEKKKDCRYPTLKKVETDDSISFMNPLVEAFRKDNRV